MGGAGTLVACIGFALLVSSGVLAAEPGEHLASFGPDGTAASNFESVGPVAVDQVTGAVYIGDRQKQALYKFDGEGNPLGYGGSAPYISGNEISGRSFNSDGESQAAVDSDSHVIYVTGKNEIQAFEADGEPHLFTAGPGAGTSEIPGAARLVGVAVDRDGNIYGSDIDAQKVRIYSPTGALITEFKPDAGPAVNFQPSTVAVSPDGTLYVTNFINRVFAFTPSSFPIKASTAFGEGQPMDGNISFVPAVDPQTSYVYIGQQDSVANFQMSVYDELGGFIGRFGAFGEEGELKGAPLGVAINGESERAYVAANNPGNGYVKVEIYQTFAIPETPPTIAGTSITGLTSEGGALRAKINPNTRETTYRFEYGTVDCAANPGACTEVPIGGGSIGAGHNFVPVSAVLGGLLPGTVYHYRVVAENDLGLTEGPVRTFKTQGNSAGASLIDDRVWEQVTPANKFGGSITNAGLLQSAADGSGIAFQTRGSIVEDPEGSRPFEPSATLARRTEAGWGVADLVPPHTKATGFGLGPEFKLFSTSLDRALLEPRDETALSIESSERSPYLRSNTSPPSYRPLVTSKEGFANVPTGTVFGGEVNAARNPVSVAGANADLTHVVIRSIAPLVTGAAAGSLYQWFDGDLRPVSELPAGDGGGIFVGQPGSGVVSGHHAVSDDGARVFWSPGDNSSDLQETDIPALYLRDMAAEVTSRIDVVQPGGSGTGEPRPVFMGASADGTVVFFTDSQQLTAGASPKGYDLYRCEIGDIGGSLGCTGIENLSLPVGAPGESAEVLELSPGMSDDGSKLYFVATGVLDAEPNQFGDSAELGAPNLYLWQEGEGVRFIATLSPNDDAVWGEPANLKLGHSSLVAAYSSPGGDYLTFMSEQNLAGDESNDLATDEPVEQAFLYDAAADSLICASCNPSGSTDAGRRISESGSEGGVIFPDPQLIWRGRWVGATLPEPSEGEPTIGYALYQPRAVLDNGRVFFNSVGALVAADSNATWDVYQYEPLGVGNCNPAAGNEMVTVRDDGCTALISSGADALPSVFMDASESGDDVFIATFARLSALDSDDIVDVYDARVDGVAAVAEQRSECIGEACRPAAPPPTNSTPGSATFNGSGNVKPTPPKHCRKGQRKVRKKGKVKCVSRSKNGKHGKQGGAR
jgi:hypothetical protein